MRERRKLQRFVLGIPADIEVMPPAGKGRKLGLRASNICSGGAFFPTSEFLPLGTHLKLDFELPMDRLRDLVDCTRVSLRVSGTVLRSGSAGMAVGFDSNYQIVPS